MTPTDVGSALADARREERERCAKIADDWSGIVPMECDPASDIADRIRAEPSR
jgi:hypothetical protein